jgi:hypothetical protein
LNFEWSFRGGDILTLAGGLFVAFAFIYGRGSVDTTVKITLDAMTDQLKEMKAEMSEFRKAMTKLAVQDERLNAISTRLNTLDTRYDEIRRGEGLITKQK